MIDRTKASLDWLTARPIAHRGYHDGNVDRYENSLSALRAAADRGFAIECDVQPTADGDVVVFHDGTLDRLTGVSGGVRERTSAELEAIPLGDTPDTIPTLAGALRVVGARVPIVIEMKGPIAPSYVDAVLRSLRTSECPSAVMSFDHDLVLAALDRGVRVGLTAEGTTDDEFAQHAEIAHQVEFLSYNVDHLPNPFVDNFRTSGRPVITWTVRTPSQRKRSNQHADQMTFEGFDPSAELPQ